MSTDAITPELFEEVGPADPKARRLHALAGPGIPYIFITAHPNGVDIDTGGINPDDLPMVLQELIDKLVS